MGAGAKRRLSPEAAEFLLAIDFGESDLRRMLQLAERSEAGTLSPEEQLEFDGLPACWEPAGCHAIQGPACSQNEATGFVCLEGGQSCLAILPAAAFQAACSIASYPTAQAN